MRNFFKTVAIVTVFSVSEKFLGFLYRIFMSRMIGAEGVGMYQIALSVFALILTVVCSGTPITVSRLMTKYKAEGNLLKKQKVITAGITLTLILAVPIFIIIFLFHSSLSFIFADERVMKIFLVILPGLIFTSVYAVLRGVFWGNKDFLPYSIIELLEEICMIVVGTVLLINVTEAYDGAFRAGIAVLVSYIFSFTLATTVFFIRKNKLKSPWSEMKPLLRSAAPITAMRTANSLITSLVSIILPMRLMAFGYTSEYTMSVFGSAVGQAIPLLFIPTTLIGSFTLVLIPEISENYYGKNYFFLKRDMEKAVKFAVLLTAVFVPVFCSFGLEMGIIVFGNHECGEYLSRSAFLMMLMSVSSITTSMLNSIGKENRTLLYFIVSSALMILCIWFLPKFFGIYALLIGFTFVFGVTSLMNLRLINKECKEKPRYAYFTVMITLLLIPSVIFGFLIKRLMLPALGTVLTFFIGGGITTILNILLYLGFGLINFDVVKGKTREFFKLKKRKVIHKV